MRSFRHLATAQHPRTRNPPNAVAARNNYSPTNLLFETVPRWTTQLRSSLLHCYTMGTAQALPAIHELTHFDRRDLKSPYKSEIPFDPNAGHVTLLYDFHNFLSSLYKVFPSTHLFFYIQKDIAKGFPPNSSYILRSSSSSSTVNYIKCSGRSQDIVRKLFDSCKSERSSNNCDLGITVQPQPLIPKRPVLAPTLAFPVC